MSDINVRLMIAVAFNLAVIWAMIMRIAYVLDGLKAHIAELEGKS